MAQQSYVLNGPKTFFFPFAIRQGSQLALSVQPDGTVVPVADYTVQGAAPGAIAVNVTWPDAPTDGTQTLVISRELEVERQTDFTDDAAVPARSLNIEYDHIYQLLTDFNDELSLALRGAPGDLILTATNTVLPAIADRAERVVAFDETGAPTYPALLSSLRGDIDDPALTPANTIIPAVSARANRVLGFNSAGVPIYTPFVSFIELDPSVLTVRQFGAVGDGVTDDLPAIQDAVDFAAANGLRLTGESRGIVYGVDGNLNLPANARVRDLHLKQLDPVGGDEIRTLTTVTGADNLFLERIVVDMNGDGTQGGNGIYIAGGSNHVFEDLEVTGDLGTGRAIFIVTASNFVLTRAYVHDINFLDTVEPTDDRINGIMCQACTDFVLDDCRSIRLGGDFGTGQVFNYSRGFVFTGCENFKNNGFHAEDVGQGVDHTGNVNNGNVNFTLVNGQVLNCNSWGVKFANSGNTGSVSAVTARDCGLGGFVVSEGSGAFGGPVSKDITFTGCVAIDTGSNGEHASPRGFQVMSDSGDTPVGIKFVNCLAIDEQTTPTMLDGFRNQSNPMTGRLNECINCESVGHTGVAFNGMHFPVMTSRITSTSSIPHATTVDVVFSAVFDDTSMMRQGATTLIQKSGNYRIRASLAYEFNATGARYVRLEKNGSLLQEFQRPADADVATYLEFETSAVLEAGDTLKVRARQESGVALDLLVAGTYFNVSHNQ